MLAIFWSFLLVPYIYVSAEELRSPCIYRESDKRLNCRRGGVIDGFLKYLPKNKEVLELDLGQNNITNTTFVAELWFFFGRNNVTALYVDNNHISHLPPKVFEPLPALQYLDLSFNDITRIDHSFCHTPDLTSIDLRGNCLRMIKKSAFHCQKNVTVYLSKCGVSSDFITCNSAEADFYSCLNQALPAASGSENSSLEKIDPVHDIDLYLATGEARKDDETTGISASERIPLNLLFCTTCLLISIYRQY